MPPTCSFCLGAEQLLASERVDKFDPFSVDPRGEVLRILVRDVAADVKGFVGCKDLEFEGAFFLSLAVLQS